MRILSIVVVLVATTACNLQPAPKPAPPKNLTGVIGAASYEIDVPGQWNGTLFLYSHGYVRPGGGNAAESAPAGIGRTWLLDHHFAAAGSAYSSTGWAVEDGLRDQIALLDYFTKAVGKPRRVIAWGHSLGGLITAGLVQLHPERFAAAMPLCGALAGSVATWNSGLDGAYAFKTLLAPDSALELVHITDAQTNLSLAEQVYAAAQATPQGQARLALVAALLDLPGWFSPTEAEPAATDYLARARAQGAWESDVDFGFEFAGRLELEQRAGGNPSWNEGVDYTQLLAQSSDAAEVAGLYSAAGLNLDSDVARLNAGPRIKADPEAAAYLSRFITFDGNLSVPTLSMHTTGDGLVVPPNETAYAQVVGAAGKQNMLRQVFVHRAGHCTFSAAETIAAVQMLLKRLDTGRWDDQALQPAALNAAAHAQGTSASLFFGARFDPSFVSFQPGGFPRPFSKGATIPA